MVGYLKYESPPDPCPFVLRHRHDGYPIPVWPVSGQAARQRRGQQDQQGGYQLPNARDGDLL